MKPLFARGLLSLLLLHLAACSTLQPVDLEYALQTAQAADRKNKPRVT